MGRIVTLKELAQILPPYTATLVGGVFDLFHAGHLRYLRECSQIGRPLVVMVQSDKTVNIRKGFNRPIVCENHRAQIVAALEMVDYVLILERPSHHPIYLQAIKPKYFVFFKETMNYRRKVAERISRQFPETRVVFLPGRIVPGCHTSILAKKISRHRDYAAISDPIKRRLYEIADQSKARVGKISALLVRGNEIVAESDNDESTDVHAECSVMKVASAEGLDLGGLDMYVLISPCLYCAEEIVRQGIKRVFYLHSYGNGEGIRLLHKHEVVVKKISF